MTESPKTSALPNGTPVLVLSQEHIGVLIEFAEGRLWWNGTKTRLKAMTGWGVAAAGLLTMLSLWWPWIARIVGLILLDVPK